MLAMRAFRNMTRAAARDPLWAISTLILRAVHGGKHLVLSLSAAAIVALVLFAIVAIALDTLGLYRTWLNPAANLAVLGLVICFLARLLVAPMIPASSPTYSARRLSCSKP